MFQLKQLKKWIPHLNIKTQESAGARKRRSSLARPCDKWSIKTVCRISPYLAVSSDSDPLSAVYLADTVILQTVGESKKAALNLKKSRSHTSIDLML